MDHPDIRYATTSGGLRLAYQKWGEGPPLLIVPAFISNVEVHEEHEFYQRTRRQLGRYLTCVEFDKRGIGLSDRFEGDPPSLLERIEDIQVVMDDVGWDSAHLLGVSEGGAMAQLFAADHPHRVETVTLLNTVVPPRYRSRIFDRVEPGDPPLKRSKEIMGHFMAIADSWSTDPTVMVDWHMPSQTGNEAFARWIGRLQRFSATPKDFVKQLESIFSLDAGDAPERIQCPTLIMHVKGDRVLPVAGSRVLAGVIERAEYVEISGEDHFAWVMPHWRQLTDTLIEFATGLPAENRTMRRFATVLFTDIVDSTSASAAMGDSKWRDVLDGHDRITREVIGDAGGRVVKSTGDGLLALFDMPSQAIDCALRMAADLGEIGLRIRAGAHAGEIEVHDDDDISGLTVNLAARVEQHAGDGELWVSSTIRDMMLGTDASFSDQGEHQLKGIDGQWRLFSVTRQ